MMSKFIRFKYIKSKMQGFHHLKGRQEACTRNPPITKLALNLNVLEKL